MLQAVMKPNERKARPTCKRAAKSKPRNPATEVWEVSDGELTCSETNEDMGDGDGQKDDVREINLEPMISEPLAPEAPPMMLDDISLGVEKTLPPVESGYPMDICPAVPMESSPMPTELECSEDPEIILLEDTPVKGCFCDRIEHPDTQPEFYEDWYVCDFCRAQRHPMDDIPTEIDDVATEAAAASMIQYYMDHVNENGVEGGEKSPLPAKTYRRLRPLISEPVMVDSPGAPDVVETTGDCGPPEFLDDDLGNDDQAEDMMVDDIAPAEKPASESRCGIDSPKVQAFALLDVASAPAALLDKEGSAEASKYPLPSAASYMAEVHKEVESMDPPEFSTQGEAAGKRKGRKAQPEKAEGKLRGRAKAKAKAAPRSKAPPRSKAAKPRGRGANAKSKATPKRKAAAPKQKASPKRKAAPRSKAKAAPQAEVADVAEVPEVSEPKPKRKPRAPKAPAAHEEERIPPPHVTHNHIYSSAYRRSLALSPGDIALAKRQGGKAVDHFKTHGTVNGLCVIFRAKPRGVQMEQAFVHTPGKFTCIDMFAGRARISKAFTEIGHKVCTLDISRDEADDILEPKGFCRHLLAVLQLATTGLVEEQVIAQKTVLLDRMRSPQDWLIPWFHERLRRRRYIGRRGLVIHYTDRRGRRRFKGGQRLKESQAYPIRFARAVRDAWLPLHNPAAPPQNLMSTSAPVEPMVNHEKDTWDDANLEHVMSWLETYLNERRSKSRRESL
ncbi:unnamed protein product [Cladocopium goreaui]|uniref:Uncharacterized protein n=1 Tax=Cladocopium goreaui TaxID=2562237 RepID=A0A9P1FY69_9DINO|nr:unnamed protein product [Cladocopium goreaui]